LVILNVSVLAFVFAAAAADFELEALAGFDGLLGLEGVLGFGLTGGFVPPPVCAEQKLDTVKARIAALNTFLNIRDLQSK
jgi:hypothetical protein